MNTYVKEIMKAAKGEKAYYFSFRETHFCHAVTNWVPIETVSKLLEHTELSTTQIYARVMENKISGDKSMLEKTMAKKNKKILNL
ncbi:hypothetical protein APR41_06880 [Salegentibacter salinarum]|uniref:Uncharacterized protein n=2 Tax=Salegentibacter salinarum TaxID=447422 RepID=A0A2N0TQY7_9FLAO|nr:tyrosine-type recombinase/integrase [Salegentibacter salinarum]PKD17152.1 hypothetical protein APR41_06880 [Salegentibacter salinarum]